MRVLQILHDRERGGITTLADMIKEGLESHGIAVETDFLFPQPGLSLGTLPKLYCAGAMARRILRGGFDALVTYQATASILAGTIGRLQGCRLRIVHQTCTPGATAAPVRMIDKLVGSLGLYTVNIANSVATENEFKSYPWLYRRHMTLIEHGLDAPAARRSRGETRRHFGLPAAEPVLLNIGRLVAQKNQDVLIRALKDVPGAHLAIAGSGANETAYRALAADLGVGERLHLLGALSSDDVADLYACADLFVFPSTWETFGLAAVEAAMMRLPVVVADLAVLREVLSTPGPQAAVFVDPFDVARWAAAIRTQLQAPPAPDAIATFAQAVALKYSRKRMIDSYLKLLSPGAPPSLHLTQALRA
jgi:glycosyltransferase involved in cell wall biosynthesis